VNNLDRDATTNEFSGGSPPDGPREITQAHSRHAKEAWSHYETRLFYHWLNTMVTAPDARVASASLELREALDALVHGPDREVDR
jgi:hypothetical protein